MHTTPHTLQDWLAHCERLHPKHIELGLERVRAVAERMKLRFDCPVFTVAGTNGKGSTCAMLEAILLQAGYRTGLYTSPHLIHFEERCRIRGQSIDAAELVACLEQVEAARGEVSLTYFEAGTLAALWLFERAALDLAVLEVGLGGRLDAVNIVDADCAVITTVDLDHQDWLGYDIEAIGFEKAGIARAWKPLVLGDDDPPASVLRHAYGIGASSWRIANDFFAEPIDATRWRWREVGFEMDLPMPALAAPVQLRNAACAIAALRAIGVEADVAAFARGLADARIDARLQRFDANRVEVIVDVGHNPQAARALAAALAATPTSGRTLSVYAALSDKDASGVAEALAAIVDGWYLAGSLNAGSRGIAVEALRRRLPAELAVIAAATDVDGAINRAMADAQAGDRLLVFGGFHVAERALKRFAAGEAAATNGL